MKARSRFAQICPSVLLTMARYAIESRPLQLLGSSELLAGSVSKLSLRMETTESEGLLTMPTIIISVTGIRSFPWWQLMSAIFYLTMEQMPKRIDTTC